MLTILPVNASDPTSQPIHSDITWEELVKAASDGIVYSSPVEGETNQVSFSAGALMLEYIMVKQTREFSAGQRLNPRFFREGQSFKVKFD